MDLKKIRELLMKDLNEWTHKECIDVDQAVKESALSNLEGKLRAQGVPDNIADFVVDMSRYSYGSIEVDAFLMSMDAYDMNLIADFVKESLNLNAKVIIKAMRDEL